MRRIILTAIALLLSCSVLYAKEKKIADRYCTETGFGTFVFNIGKRIPNGEFYQVHAVLPTGDVMDFPGQITEGNENGVDVVHILDGHAFRYYGPLVDCKKQIKRPKSILPKNVPKTESESGMKDESAAKQTRKANEHMHQLEEKRNAEAESRASNEHQQGPVDTAVKVSGNSPGTNAYLKDVRQRISKCWSAPTQDLTDHAYVVIVQFRLHRNGTVTGVSIEQSSGNEYYDLAGKRAVLSATPLPVFPADISDSYFDAHFTFTIGEPQE